MIFICAELINKLLNKQLRFLQFEKGMMFMWVHCNKSIWWYHHGYIACIACQFIVHSCLTGHRLFHRLPFQQDTLQHIPSTYTGTEILGSGLLYQQFYCHWKNKQSALLSFHFRKIKNMVSKHCTVHQLHQTNYKSVFSATNLALVLAGFPRTYVLGENMHSCC